MHRRTQITIATFAVAALAASPAAAQTADDTYSEAGATALEVDGVVTVSSTEASTQDDGSASATVIAVGDETVVGDSQEGPGEVQGEILTTGEDNEQGYLTIGGHEATVEEDRSHARTAVADGNLGGDEGVTVTVLESRSTAADEGSDAETTGAAIDLGGQLRVEVLHANTSSSGDGGSYVLGINDEQLFSSEQADGQCSIDADPLLQLLCLYAAAVEGEDGLTGGTAGVLDVTGLDGNLTGRAFDATATSGPADGGDGEAPAPAGDDGPAPAPDAGDDGEPAAPAGTLPRTGGGLAAGLLGLLAMGAGEGLRRFKR